LPEYKIAVIPGDGIGKEVMPEGVKALEAAAERADVQLRLEHFPWSCDYYVEHGRMMPEDAITRLRAFDAIYLGAIGDPDRVPDDISLRESILALRFGLDQFANVRPTRALPGAPCPLANVAPEAIDFVVVREATEGFYLGEGGHYGPGSDDYDSRVGLRDAFVVSDKIALQTGVFSTAGCWRVMEYAFGLAESRNAKRRVTSCTKTNALSHAMGLWDEVFADVAAEHPDIASDSCYVDALSMNLVLKPQTYDVIVAPNLFGDIITDLASSLVGGLGFAPGGNINPEGVSMFEPPHGSAPDIAGQQKANPIATILTGATMMQHLGEGPMAEDIWRGVGEVVAAGEVRTPDMGGTARTDDVGEAVAAAIRGAQHGA
jgi:tartrate dehydrogenase